MRKHTQYYADQEAEPYTIVCTMVEGKRRQTAYVVCEDCGRKDEKMIKVNHPPEAATRHFHAAGWRFKKGVKCPNCAKKTVKVVDKAPTKIVIAVGLQLPPISAPKILEPVVTLAETLYPLAEVLPMVKQQSIQKVVRKKAVKKAVPAIIVQAIQQVLMKPLENLPVYIADLMSMEKTPESAIGLRDSLFFLYEELEKYNSETLIPLEFAIFENRLILRPKGN